MIYLLVRFQPNNKIYSSMHSNFKISCLRNKQWISIVQDQIKDDTL